MVYMKGEDIKTIGIMGAGVMGGGIGQTAILAGYNVVIRDLSDEINQKARDTITDGRFGLKGGVARGKQTQEQMDAAMAKLTFTTKVEDLKDVDLLIEAIGGSGPRELENKDLKLKVFAEMDGIVKKDAIFASNTSVYTIADLAVSVSDERKKVFIGMHWFSPANIMKLVEIIHTEQNSEELIKTMEDVCDKLEKVHVRCKDVPGDTGFIGNRVMGAARREAMKILEEGIATGPDISAAMINGFNWPAFAMPGGAGGPGARSGWQ